MDILFNDTKNNLNAPGTLTATIIDSVYSTVVAGATIELSDSMPTVLDTQVSDGAGIFTTISVPGPTTYTLTITNTGYDPLVMNDVLVIGDTDLGNIPLDPSIVLYGSVSGLVHDTFDFPIPTASVTIQNSNGYISETIPLVDSLGDFIFPSLPVCTGCYTITASATGFTSANETNITVSDSTNTDAGTIYLESITNTTGTISGNVIDSVYGFEIPGATVDIMDWNIVNHGPLTTQSSPNDGDFTSGTLNSELYDVIVSMPGYNSTTITDISVVGLTDLGDVLLVPKVIQNGSVSGVVHDTYHNPVSGANVNISSGSGFIDIDVSTDGSGNFSFPTVPADSNYTITVTMSGYSTASVNNITVTDATNTDVGTIYIQSTSATSGIIGRTTVDAIDLSIVEGANIEIVSWDNTIVDTQASDTSGFSQSIILSPGAYSLRIDKIADGYGVNTTSGIIVNDNAPQGNILMPRSVINYGSLIGKVVDLNWNPVSGATVTFDNTIGSTTQTTTTDGSGNFNFAAVPEGTNFVLQVTQTGYFPTAKNNITINASSVNDAVYLFIVPTTASSGQFTGRVIDSYNGLAIGAATVEFRDYNNVLIDTQISAADGSFTSAVMPPGSYTVIAKKTGYFDLVLDNRILDSNKDLHELPLCEVLTGNQIRLYVVWANQPGDLDLHVVGPTTNANTGHPNWDGPPDNRFHTFFSTDGYNEDTGEYTSSTTSYTNSLVLDDIDGSGPETINMGGNYANGDYNFTVHLAHTLFSDPGAYWYDGAYTAIVRVYDSRGLVREIPFPSTPPAPAAYYWKICRINKFGPGDNDMTVTVPTANPYLFHALTDYNDKSLMDWTFKKLN